MSATLEFLIAFFGRSCVQFGAASLSLTPLSSQLSALLSPDNFLSLSSYGKIALESIGLSPAFLSRGFH